MEWVMGVEYEQVTGGCVVKSHVSIIVQENTGHFFVANDPRRKGFPTSFGLLSSLAAVSLVRTPVLAGFSRPLLDYSGGLA